MVEADAGQAEASLNAFLHDEASHFGLLAGPLLVARNRASLRRDQCRRNTPSMARSSAGLISF